MKGFEQYEGHTDKREKYLIHLFAFSLLTLSQVECNIHESRALSVFFFMTASPAPRTKAHTNQVFNI